MGAEKSLLLMRSAIVRPNACHRECRLSTHFHFYNSCHGYSPKPTLTAYQLHTMHHTMMASMVIVVGVLAAVLVVVVEVLAVVVAVVTIMIAIVEMITTSKCRCNHILDSNSSRDDNN